MSKRNSDTSERGSSYKSFTLKDKYERASDPISELIKKDPNSSEKSVAAASDADQREETPDTVPAVAVAAPVKYEDPNELGAKLIKAELMGDDDLVKSLKERLEVARAHAQQTKASGSGGDQQRHHHQRPPFSNNQRQRRDQQPGQRRSGGGGGYLNEVDEEQANILKRHYKGDEYDDLKVNDNQATELNKKVKRKHQHNQHNQKPLSQDEKTSIRQFEREEDTSSMSVNNCWDCFDNIPERHLVVAIGKHSYVCLPSNQSLCEGNCFIIPMSHQSCGVSCDEEVWNEMQDFRKALVRMFEKKHIDCVFCEHFAVQNKYAHLVIECIPLDQNVSNLAPIYFKKALLECESEWAQNKRIIELKKNQGLRRSIPKNMPYFTVAFGLDDGFAHVIESSETFPDHFAREVVGGILDLDPLSWRRPKRDNFAAQSKKVMEFLKWWKPYDFTLGGTSAKSSS